MTPPNSRTGRLHSLATRFRLAALEFLYPPECRLCGSDLSAWTGTGDPPAFCDHCLAGLNTDDEPTCRGCGAGIGPYVDRNLPCAYCRGESFAFDAVWRLGVYEKTLQEAILRGKRRGGAGVVQGLADLVWQRHLSDFASAGVDVVIPVPLHRWQGMFRSHNPAEELARAWGRRLNIPVATHILRKTRWTEAQARLPPAQRRVNVKNAFAVTAGMLPAGATVLLADDVLTTGTTAHEAARVLHQAGAVRVIVGVVARGLGRRS